MNQNLVLVVEDEREIAELVRDYLKREQFEVHLARDGEEGLRLFRQLQPTLIILDLMLPKLDGMEFCRIVRNESNVPILMMSAKKSEMDKILGLTLGADDYITKPFSPGELVARVKASIRRYLTLSHSPKSSGLIEFGDIKIDPKSYECFVKGERIQISAKEFSLLHYLMSNPDQVFTREQLFYQVWGEFGDINTVTVHIRKLREKLEENPANPQYIVTVWGVGYKFRGSSWD